jgi:hypothetical protein
MYLSYFKRGKRSATRRVYRNLVLDTVHFLNAADRNFFPRTRGVIPGPRVRGFIGHPVEGVPRNIG